MREKARVVAVINQKGGVGKTTIAHNLSAAFVARGQRVLVIDLDSQGHLTRGLGLWHLYEKEGRYPVSALDSYPCNGGASGRSGSRSGA